MVDADEGTAVRSVGFVYGVVSIVAGIAVFVLFVGIPVDLLYLLPPVIGRSILNVAPWFVTAGAGQPSGAKLLALVLASVAFVVFGLWSLRKALFGSIGSLSDVGNGVGGGRD
jgi:hypothetical protein